MAKIENVNLDFFTKWEGGLSKDPGDPAAAHPVPDGKGFHTNIGITWLVFSANAAALGYPGTPEHFYAMPQSTWKLIYGRLFWDGVKADKISSQVTAEFLAEWGWGSGPGTAIREMQNYLKSEGFEIKADGKIGPVSLKALNDQIAKKGERIVFEDLDRIKRNFLKKTSGYQRFGLGWYNRMDDFRDNAVKTLSGHS